MKSVAAAAAPRLPGRAQRRRGLGLRGGPWLAALWLASPAAAQPTPHGDDDQTLYALGLRCGYDLMGFALGDAELAAVERGLRDGAQRRPPEVNERAYAGRIDELLARRRGIAAGREEVASREWLAKLERELPGRPLPGGARYLELRPGAGPGPAPGDVVELHFHGRLRDGTVFDSSVERGLPLRVELDRLFPCWRDGLQQMRVGGKARLLCPASTAYGELGTRRVPGGAALDLEVELLALEPRR